MRYRNTSRRLNEEYSISDMVNLTEKAREYHIKLYKRVLSKFNSDVVKNEETGANLGGSASTALRIYELATSVAILTYIRSKLIEVKMNVIDPEDAIKYIKNYERDENDMVVNRYNNLKGVYLPFLKSF